MSVRAEADPTLVGGYARIIVDNLATPLIDTRFSIHREGYPAPNLGPNGWQVREGLLTPRAVRSEGGATVLIVGPEISRHMEPGPYAFSLAGMGDRSGLFWPDDIDVFLEQPPEAAPEPATPPPLPLPPKEPPKAEPPALQPPTVVRARPPLRREPGPDHGKSRSRIWLWITAAALLVAVALGAATMLFPEQRDALIARLFPEQPPPPPPQPREVTWLERSDQLTVKEIDATAPDGAALHAAALRRRAAGKFDDAFVLFEQAADRGFAASLTELGRIYDPVGFERGRGLEAPDPRAAARYYRDAEARGDASAAAPRAALRAWLEQRRSESGGSGRSSNRTALEEFWR